MIASPTCYTAMSTRAARCQYACAAGGISKGDLRRFLKWGAEHLGYASLSAVEGAPPTAELEPIRAGTAAQTDEQDMGMTYEVPFLGCCVRVNTKLETLYIAA